MVDFSDGCFLEKAHAKDNMYLCRRKAVLKKAIIQKEAKRLRWLASQCDDKTEKAFYLGAAVALEGSIGYATQEANRLEISFDHDFTQDESDDQIEWNIALHGDPFPISEEYWKERHPQSSITRLVDLPDEIDEFTVRKRHDRIR